MLSTRNDTLAEVLERARNVAGAGSSLRSVATLGLLGGVIAIGASAFHDPLPVIQPNSNVERAGVLHDRVLTVTLDARESRFFVHGPGQPATTVEAFAEPGREPEMPGPLLRARGDGDPALGAQLALPTADALRAGGGP